MAADCREVGNTTRVDTKSFFLLKKNWVNKKEEIVKRIGRNGRWVGVVVVFCAIKSRRPAIIDEKPVGVSSFFTQFFFWHVGIQLRPSR